MKVFLFCSPFPLCYHFLFLAGHDQTSQHRASCDALESDYKEKIDSQIGENESLKSKIDTLLAENAQLRENMDQTANNYTKLQEAAALANQELEKIRSDAVF